MPTHFCTSQNNPPHTRHPALPQPSLAQCAGQFCPPPYRGRLGAPFRLAADLAHARALPLLLLEGVRPPFLFPTSYPHTSHSSPSPAPSSPPPSRSKAARSSRTTPSLHLKGVPSRATHPGTPKSSGGGGEVRWRNAGKQRRAPPAKRAFRHFCGTCGDSGLLLS